MQRECQERKTQAWLKAFLEVNDDWITEIIMTTSVAPITVPERLTDLGDLYAERGKVYGDDYKRHGDLMRVFFPNGVILKTLDDFNRYGIFKELVTKLNRYSKSWSTGGHEDSLNDISVYAQMLQELDNDVRQK